MSSYPINPFTKMREVSPTSVRSLPAIPKVAAGTARVVKMTSPVAQDELGETESEGHESVNIDDIEDLIDAELELDADVDVDLDLIGEDNFDNIETLREGSEAIGELEDSIMDGKTEKYTTVQSSYSFSSPLPSKSQLLSLSARNMKSKLCSKVNPTGAEVKVTRITSMVSLTLVLSFLKVKQTNTSQSSRLLWLKATHISIKLMCSMLGYNDRFILSICRYSTVSIKLTCTPFVLFSSTVRLISQP